MSTIAGFLMMGLVALLTWQDNSNNEDGFIIDRNGGVVGSVGPDVSSFTDSLAMEGDCYKVAAFNSAGVSDWSNVACVPVVTPPPPPPPCKPRGKSGKCR